MIPWLLGLTLVSTDSVDAIAQALRQQGGAVARVQQVATAIQKYAAVHQLSPALLIGLIGIENRELNPTARNPSGATGIMQVMPHWKADIRDCGARLTDIDTNVCFGTRILKQQLDRTTTVVEALRRYGGCVSAARCAPYVQAVLRRVRAAEDLLTDLLDD